MTIIIISIIIIIRQQTFLALCHGSVLCGGHHSSWARSRCGTVWVSCPLLQIARLVADNVVDGLQFRRPRVDVFPIFCYTPASVAAHRALDGKVVVDVPAVSPARLSYTIARVIRLVARCLEPVPRLGTPR
jgi:hypothetical protein